MCLASTYVIPVSLSPATLIDAAARGANVKLILPSHIDSRQAFQVNHSHYDALLGVPICERRDALLRVKRSWSVEFFSTVSFTELDWRSFLYNHEFSATGIGATFANWVSVISDQILTNSDETLMVARQRHPLRQRLQKLFSRTWVYWL